MLPKKIPSAIPTSKQPIESSVPEQPKKSGKSPTGKNAISTISSDTSLPTLKNSPTLATASKSQLSEKVIKCIDKNITWRFCEEISENDKNFINPIEKNMVQSISTFFDQAESQRIAAFESKNKSVDPTFLKDTTQYPLEIEKFLFKDFIKYEFNMDFKLHVQVCHKNQGNLSSGQNPKKQRALDELVGELRLKVSICKRKDRKEYFSICLADNGNVALKFQKQGNATTALHAYHAMLKDQGVVLSHLYVVSYYPMTAEFYKKQGYELSQFTKQKIIKFFKENWADVWGSLSSQGQLEVMKLYDPNSKDLERIEAILKKINQYISDNYQTIYADKIEDKEMLRVDALEEEGVLDEEDVALINSIENKLGKEEVADDLPDDFFLKVFFIDSSIEFLDSDDEYQMYRWTDPTKANYEIINTTTILDDLLRDGVSINTPPLMSIKAIDQKSLQFKKIFINVGGACLFRALCWGENIINDVSQDEDKDHGGIRSQIVNHIKQNKVGFEKDLKNNFYNFINSLDAGISIQGISAEFKAKLEAIRSQDEQTIEGYLQTQWADDYLAHMNENDAWGGPAELRAAAEVMETNLEVHDSEDYSKITTYGDAEGSNTIHLEFDGSHYNLLIPND